MNLIGLLGAGKALRGVVDFFRFREDDTRRYRAGTRVAEADAARAEAEALRQSALARREKIVNAQLLLEMIERYGPAPVLGFAELEKLDADLQILLDLRDSGVIRELAYRDEDELADEGDDGNPEIGEGGDYAWEDEDDADG